ncbi:MAG: hypothetical protein M5U11_09625 [Anaerolineales bacterium]|jgi:hypothetical protein|nr:hypothetical protein [Anaerolineales bacterium]MDX9938176.1 hypothetical protein [Anaerolineales bacterium]GER80734.1 hypothetical protein DIM_28150 [Candidatus Denitrolinea symbiosum]
MDSSTVLAIISAAVSLISVAFAWKAVKTAERTYGSAAVKRGQFAHC